MSEVGAEDDFQGQSSILSLPSISFLLPVGVEFRNSLQYFCSPRYPTNRVISGCADKSSFSGIHLRMFARGVPWKNN